MPAGGARKYPPLRYDERNRIGTKDTDDKELKKIIGDAVRWHP